MQLTLPIRLLAKNTFDNFIVGENALTVEALKTIAVSGSEPYCYLWGRQGVGLSHLLQACCHAAELVGRSALYLSLGDSDLTPEVLETLDQFDFVALDDFAAVCAKPAWEEALFHFYNQMRANERSLVVVADKPVKELPIALPDLASRLTWGLGFQVHDLGDADKCRVLQQTAQQKGFMLSSEVSDFLLKHSSRNLTDLIAVMAKLEKATLEQQRRVTIPLVKQVLAS